MNIKANCKHYSGVLWCWRFWRKFDMDWDCTDCCETDERLEPSNLVKNKVETRGLTG